MSIDVMQCQNLEMSDFCWLPYIGKLLKIEQNRKIGLLDREGKCVVPCKYESLDYVILFRKGFIFAENSQGIFLYDGMHPDTICSDSYSIVPQYSFCYKKNEYYTICTTAEEYVLNHDSEIIKYINKRKCISFFHLLMMPHRRNFRFKNLKDLLFYCKQVDEAFITQEEKEELIVYAYFFFEEMLQEYAVQYNLLYTRFSFCSSMIDKEKFWGICFCQSREIQLSLRLLLTSEDFIREVMLHELVHLKYPNHGKDFYKLLHQLSGIDIPLLKKRKEAKFFLGIIWIGMLLFGRK